MVGDLSGLILRVVAALEHCGAKRQRGEWWLACPFHAEVTPSFAFRDATATFYCQGCGKGGGVIELARKLGLDTGGVTADALEAMRVRAAENAARIDELRAEKAKALATWWAAHAEETRLVGETVVLRELLAGGVRPHGVEHFRFGQSSYPVKDAVLGGWREVDALTIPWTVRGEIRALQYRLSEDVDGRYRWHEGSHATLFNADAVLDPGDDALIVVEGAKKAAALWSHGMTSVVGLASKSSWGRATEKGRDRFAAFGRVVFLLDPGATAEAQEAAATLTNGWVAHLPRKPDDLLVLTGGDVDVLDRYVGRARRP